MADLLLTAGGKTVNIRGGTTNALPQRPVAYIRIFGDTAAVSVEQNVDTVTVAGGTPAVTITSASQLRIGRPENTVIISPMGARGLPGASGASGGNTVELVAGEDIGGQRVVMNKLGRAYYASHDNMEGAHSVMGMTSGAAMAGSSVTVVVTGEITEPSWNFIVGRPVFVGANGVLTQFAPNSGYIKIVGFAVAPNKIYIQQHQPIVIM